MCPIITRTNLDNPRHAEAATLKSVRHHTPLLGTQRCGWALPRATATAVPKICAALPLQNQIDRIENAQRKWTGLIDSPKAIHIQHSYLGSHAKCKPGRSQSGSKAGPQFVDVGCVCSSAHHSMKDRCSPRRPHRMEVDTRAGAQVARHIVSGFHRHSLDARAGASWPLP